MIELIRGFWRRLTGVFVRQRLEGETHDEVLSPPAKVLEEKLPISSKKGIAISETIKEREEVPSIEGIPIPPSESPFEIRQEHEKWEVRSCKPRGFDKVGRLFIEGGVLVMVGLQYHHEMCHTGREEQGDIFH